MTLCKECGRPLKSIGTARKNGKPHPDWATREYHKKCWKELNCKYIVNENVNTFYKCQLIVTHNVQNTLRDEIHQLMNNLK